MTTTTRDGQTAKEFVERELSSLRARQSFVAGEAISDPQITITTSKSDKYDCYLADIFYSKSSAVILSEAKDLRLLKN